jgi:hypothetical protein
VNLLQCLARLTDWLLNGNHNSSPQSFFAFELKANACMKRFKITTALVALAITAIIVAAFVLPAGSKHRTTDWTNYYWFDQDGSYLWRQNTVTDEMGLTGFDLLEYSPYTLREKGFAPSAVYNSNPPVPHDPYSPDRRLYSHP